MDTLTVIVTKPRRAPAPDRRQRDAERSRAQLLDAALEEFSAKGLAGARVADIAARAGVNPQLISYYFGGKLGLYRALQRRWMDLEAAFASPDRSLSELVGAYLHASLADPRMGRLLAWNGLTGAEAAGHGTAGSEDSGGDEPAGADVADLRRRQQRGELAAEFDPAMVLIAFMGAVSAPVIMPQLLRRMGLDPSTADFEARYADQLKRIVSRLAERTDGPAPDGGN